MSDLGDTAIEGSVEQLRLLFDVANDFSVLIWRRRPQGSDAHSQIWNNRFAGKPAGSLTRKHRQIRFNIGNNRYHTMAHRVLWALRTGAWPPLDMTVDHQNGDGFTNTDTNLRLATDTEN